jgi:hypothetical protein
MKETNIVIIGDSGAGAKSTKVILFQSYIKRLKELGIKSPFDCKPEEITSENVSEVLDIMKKLNEL